MESRGQHLHRPRWWTRWWVIAAAVALVAAAATTGLVLANRAPSASSMAAAARAKAAAAQAKAAAAQAKAASAHAQAIHTAEVELASTVSVSPTSGTVKVALDAPVTVRTTAGVLMSVRVADAKGAVLAGKIARSGLEWQSSGPLQPSATYRVTAVVTRPDGLRAEKVTTFTTLTPAHLVAASVWPYDGLSVGVGQPIVFTFDQNVVGTAAQRAVLSHITISLSKPVPGGWYWFSEHELHFRPQAFWPSGEQVSVAANLNGWNAGSGQWGVGSLTDAFSVGDTRISVANLQTEKMTVTLNGKTVATYPISGGRPAYPTMDGIHIVMDRESVIQMDSASVGIPVNSPNGYNETVLDDVHISDSGEFVHSAPWSVADQGSINVSHGCINLSPTNALAFFNFSRVGDLVEVVGSPRPPAVGDHGVMDWSGPPWGQWIPATVHRLA